MKYLQTFDKAKNKKVRCGYIEDGSYHRKVNNKHYMVKENGYGIQEDVFSQLVKLGIKKIVIHAKTKDLKSTVLTWLSRGNKKDYGNGLQFFLATSYME